MGAGRSKEADHDSTETSQVMASSTSLSEGMSIQQFKALKLIGKGSFSKVGVVRKKDDKKLFALKYINKTKCLEKKAVAHIITERKILAALYHPLMVNLWYSFQDDEALYMIMDLISGGDLRYNLQKGPISAQRVKCYIAELCCAIEYIHSKGIVHRDIKPDNILLDSSGHVRVGDFSAAVSVPSSGLLFPRVGSRGYMAPEMLLQSGYTVSADWWSLGVTMWEMLIGEHPFLSETADQTVLNITTNEIKWPDSLDNHSLSFLKSLLERQSGNRIGTPFRMANLRRHPYFADLPCSWEDVGAAKMQHEYIPKKDHHNIDGSIELDNMMESGWLPKKKKEKAETAASDDDKAELLKLASKFESFNREIDTEIALVLSTWSIDGQAARTKEAVLKGKNQKAAEVKPSVPAVSKDAESDLVADPSTSDDVPAIEEPSL